MSLAGVRDMSTIDTPPEERLPVRTYVSEFSDELIREAILRELDRQGQVYFLHNRVHNIEYMANYIQRIVPECEVGIAHGQMHEGELEQAMSDFAVGKMDVLVCTTIIESGLDIPNVNTLIVNRADAFGLAQLYQLRGRVGRSSRRAYAYLLVPRARSMTEAAEKRLKAMMAATELGAGFKIAMKDLEIRGAGNILGAEQSGHIHAVGFDLYTRMLSNAVEELRALRVTGANGTTPESDAVGSPVSRNGQPPDPTIDIGIPASITQEYIPDLPTRLGIYQRLVQAANDEDLERLEDELRDRFGPLPWQVQNLLYTLRLKLRAKKAGIDGIRREQDRIVLHFRGDLGGARQALQRALPRGVEVGGTQVRMPISEMSNWEPALLELIDKLTDFTTRLLAQMAGAR
jgi:transcription-repair coupling factor (superfamily II helicase)